MPEIDRKYDVEIERCWGVLEPEECIGRDEGDNRGDVD